MRDVFRAHFRDRFARCPDLRLQEFRSYLADFPRLGSRHLLNAKSVMRWSRSASTSCLDYMVYPTKCTWGFQPGFRRWISMMYHSGFGERKAFEGVRDRAFGPAGLPLLRRLRDEGMNPAQRDVPFPGPLTARLSAFANDITVFVSRRLAVGEYERVGAKVNFDKSEGLRLGAWRGSENLPGPFRWSDGHIRILGVWSGPTSSWSEIGWKHKLRWMLWWEPSFQVGCP